MGLATGVNLADPGAVIDALVTELTAQNWTINLNNAGGVGVREIYFSKLAADTFNGEDMVFGVWWASTDRLEISGSNTTYTLWTNAGTDLISNNFDLSTHPNPELVLRNSTTGFWETRVEDLNTGGNYIQHWIFTPVDTALVSPADHQYVYMVIETLTGSYRSFFFGEIEKYDGDNWVGGAFFEGNSFDAIGGRDVRPFAGGFTHNIFAGNRGAGAMYLSPVNTPAPDILVTPGNTDFVVLGTIGGTTSIEHPYEGPGMGRRNVGEDHYERSNAPFSLQAQRWPAEWFTQRVHAAVASQPENIVPLGRTPDFFHTNIANFTPGTVIVDDTENFLVVPVSSKGGALNTGNEGFLIRNPLL